MMCHSLEHACRELVFCLHPPSYCSLLVSGEAGSKDVWGHGWHLRTQHAQSGLCLTSTITASPRATFLHEYFLVHSGISYVSREHPFFYTGFNLAALSELFAVVVKQLKQNDPAVPS